MNLPSAFEQGTEPLSRSDEPEWQGIAAVLAAADRLTACSTLDQLLETAIAVAHDSIGFERAGIYLLDPPPSRLLHGTFGTGRSGETIDERAITLEISELEQRRLLELPQNRTRCLYFTDAEHVVQESGRSTIIGRGWLAITPLISEGELLGVLHNDAALSHKPIDLGRQACAAVFCSLLAIHIAARQKGTRTRSTPRDTERGSVVRRVQRTLDASPCVSGEQLARDLSISAGYLARVFRTEVGMSLVEYRNQLRIDRFLRMVGRDGGNLCEAAIEAGFGSYAQFHRVFRRHVGTTPREYITSTQAGNSRVQPSATSE